MLTGRRPINRRKEINMKNLSQYSKEQKDYLIERAKFAENGAKVLDEMADELRSLNFAIEACGRDGKIEYEKACSLAVSVVKIAANYLSNSGNPKNG
jgi:hypothetical protein